MAASGGTDAASGGGGGGAMAAASPSSGGAAAGGERRGGGGSLERRGDMQLAKKSLKTLRGLCKEYGLSFRLPAGSAFGASNKRGRRRRVRDPVSPTSPLSPGRPSPRRGGGGGGGGGGSGEESSSGEEEADGPSSSSGSSSFEFSSEEEKDGLSDRTKWDSVKAMLEGLQTDERVGALEDINDALGNSSEAAEASLHELSALERARRSRWQDRRRNSLESLETDLGAVPEGEASLATGGAGGEEQEEQQEEEEKEEAHDEKLLNFSARDMPVAHALQRCIETVPKLRKLAREKEEARREAQRRAQEEENRKRRENGVGGDDPEADENGLLAEVERKMRALGDLPYDADPDLLKVLQAQRSEIRSLARSIKESEREVTVKRLALDYVDGKMAFQGLERDLINDAISTARDMKASLFSERMAAEEQKMQEQKKGMDLPSEQEVQEAIKEQVRLEKEVERASEHIKRMQEMMKQAALASQQAAPREEAGGESASETQSVPHTPASQPSPSAGGGRARRRALQNLTSMENAPVLPVELDKVGEVYPKLLKESAEMDESIQHEDRRIAAAEGLLKNAEQTLKVLEECKILFLEQVAHEKPQLIDDLLAAEAEKNAKEDEKSSLASETDTEDEDDGQQPLLALGAEERWLRMQLTQGKDTDEAAEEDEDDDENEDEESSDEGETELSSEAHRHSHPFEEVASGIMKLVRRLEAQDARARGESPPPEEDEPEQETVESALTPRMKEIQQLSREEATERLKNLPHTEIKNLLRLRDENDRLVKRITEVQAELDRLRGARGATQKLLGPSGVPGAVDLVGKGSEAPDSELVAEVQRKVRELQTLRKRWWAERQDPSTTVRRALATAGIPEVEGEEDQPPIRVQASLMERIFETFTLP